MKPVQVLVTSRRPRAVWSIMTASLFVLIYAIILLFSAPGFFGLVRSVAELIAIWACLGKTRPLIRWPVSIGLWTLLAGWTLWVTAKLSGRVQAEPVLSVVETTGVVILLFNQPSAGRPD